MESYAIHETFNEDEQKWDVKLFGEFDAYNAQEFKQKIIGLFDRTPADILLDCAELKFVDSMALGAIVAACKSAEAHSRKIFVSNTSRFVRKLFRVSKLDKSFPTTLFMIEGESDE